MLSMPYDPTANLKPGESIFVKTTTIKLIECHDSKDDFKERSLRYTPVAEESYVVLPQHLPEEIRKVVGA